MGTKHATAYTLGLTPRYCAKCLNHTSVLPLQMKTKQKQNKPTIINDYLLLRTDYPGQFFFFLRGEDPSFKQSSGCPEAQREHLRMQCCMCDLKVQKCNLDQVHVRDVF